MSGLPEGWAITSPTVVAEPIRGVTYKKDQARDTAASGFTPLLRANNLQQGRLVQTDLVYVPDENVSENQMLRPNDVVIAMSSGSISVVGKTAQVAGDVSASFGAFCGVLRPSPEMDPRYLGWFLKSDAYRTGISQLARGVNINNLKWSHFQEIPLPLAPRPEQKRIADKLDSVLARVDACRDRLDRIPALLKRFRQSVLAAATSGRLTEDWRAVNVMPPWRASDIQSVAQVATGSTPLRSNSTFYAETGTPWITSAATSQPVVIAAEQFVTDEAVAAHRLKVFPVGTLLVAMYGEGKTRGQVTELGLPATINQACAAVVVDEHMALRGYVKLVLQANYMQMRELAEGGNQPNLNLSKVKEFPLLLPPLAEQHEIVRCVETLFAFADRVEARCAAARKQAGQLTPALLAKAFRGELVPQDPADEPAAELLKRLAARRAEAPKARRG
ncbi:restriction endonuclease subunit S, partial [Thauera sp. 63]|uniref:restriction endonuclease subunit S n=1 Tax=Thauera sp. 63 TaxID=497321 RepID=UPI0002CE231C